MNVKKLIEQLERYDENLEVMYCCEGCHFSIESYTIELSKYEYDENKDIVLIG